MAPPKRRVVTLEKVERGTSPVSIGVPCATPRCTILDASGGALPSGHRRDLHRGCRVATVTSSSGAHRRALHTDPYAHRGAAPVLHGDLADGMKAGSITSRSDCSQDCGGFASNWVKSTVLGAHPAVREAVVVGTAKRSRTTPVWPRTVFTAKAKRLTLNDMKRYLAASCRLYGASIVMACRP